MSISAKSYFTSLREYLETDKYEHWEFDDKHTILAEDVVWNKGDKPKKLKLKLVTPGEVIVINLDSKFTTKDERTTNGRGSFRPLFHFLVSESKPWSKCCDYILFHLYKDKIHAYCIEFKSNSFPDTIKAQLDAGEAWCRSLQSVIKHYTGDKRRFQLSKYVLTCHDSPDAYLTDDKKYLKKDHTVRHYHYDDIQGTCVTTLENQHIKVIQ